MANKLKSTTIQGDLLVTSNTKVDGTIIGNVSGNATSADKVSINTAATGTSLKIVATDSSGTKTPNIVPNANITIDNAGAVSISINGSLEANNVTAATLSGNGAGITNINAANITGTIDESLIDITTKASIATAASAPITLGNSSQTLTINASSATINGDTSFTGNVNISGNVNIGGGIAIDGDKTIVDATTISTTDKLIELGKGNTTALTNYAGFYVPKYDGTNTGALVFDKDGIARIGDVTVSTDGSISSLNPSNLSSSTSLQPLATRSESITNQSILKWDNLNKTIVGASASDIRAIYISDTNDGKVAFVSNSGNESSIYRSNISITSKNTISGVEGITSNTVTANTITATIGISTATLNSDSIVNGKVELSSDNLIVKGSNNATVIDLSSNGNIDALTASIPTVTGNLVGNADTATALETSRNFSISGGATAAAVAFNGTANVQLNVTAVQPSVIVTGTIGTSTDKVDLVGNAESATVASSLTTSTAGTASLPVYFNNGIPVQTSTTLGVCISGIAAKSDTEFVKDLSNSETTTYMTGVTGSGDGAYEQLKRSGVKATIGSNDIIELSTTAANGSVNISGQAKTVAETINLSKNTSGSINLGSSTGSRQLDVTITNIGDATVSANIPVHQDLSIDSDKSLVFNGSTNGWTLNTSTNDLIIDSDGVGKTVFNNNTDVLGDLRAPLIKAEVMQFYLTNQSASSEHPDFIKLEPNIVLNDNDIDFYSSLKFNRYSYDSSTGSYYVDNIKTTVGSESSTSSVLFPIIVNSSNGHAVMQNNTTAEGEMLKLYKGGIISAKPGIDYLTAAADIIAKSIYASPIDQNTSGINNYTATEGNNQVTENTERMRNILFMPFYQLTNVRRSNNSVTDNGYELKAVLPQNIITVSNGEASISAEPTSQIDGYLYPYIERKITVQGYEGYIIHGKITTAEIAETVSNFNVSQNINNSTNIAVLYNIAASTTKAAIVESGKILGTRKNADQNVELADLTYSANNTGDTIVYRDASGNFSAGTITANLSGNASSASTLETAREFSITGGATAAAVAFNGNGNVALNVTSVAPNVISSGTIGTSTAKVNLVGNASTATEADKAKKLSTARNITIQGENLTNALATSTYTSSFDGSADIVLNINRKIIHDALGFDPVDDASAMTYKGTIKSTDTISASNLVNGDVYVASEEFTFKYDTSTGEVLGSSANSGEPINVETGDMLIFYKNIANNVTTIRWDAIEKNSSDLISFNGVKANIINNELPIFNKTSDKNLKKSGITVTVPSGTSKGIIDADITGYAPTAGAASIATTFASNATVQLTGDVTGSSTSTKGWTFATTIAANAVTTAKIANGNVTTDKIANLNVTTAKIANSAVTNDKINSVNPSKIVSVTGDTIIGTSDNTVNLYGNASTATTATYLASDSGSSTRPVYFSGGVPVQTSTTLGVCITGNASTATKATTVCVTTISANDTNNYQFTSVDTSGNIQKLPSSLLYSPSANTLTAGTFSGNLVGNASTATIAEKAHVLTSVVSSVETPYTVGDSKSPVYFSGGVPYEVDGTIDVSISGKAATAGAADTATTATNLSGTSANSVPYQSASKTTSYVNSAVNSVLGWDSSKNITTLAYATNVVDDSLSYLIMADKGNFTANVITATLSGNASTATTASYLVSATNNVGSSTIPVYFSNGVAVTTNTTLDVCINGNASTATTASKVNVTDIASTSNADWNLITVDSGSVKKLPNIQYKPSTGVLTVGTVSGNLSGNATSASKVMRNPIGSTTAGYLAAFSVNGSAATTSIYSAALIAINGNTIGNSDNKVNLVGNAETATTAGSANTLTTDSGSSTIPVYFSGGVPVQTDTTLDVCINGNAATATQIKRNQLTSTSTGYLAAFTESGAPGNSDIYSTASIAINGNTIGNANNKVNLVGNASTAGAFASSVSVTLTGDVTGSSTSTKGWTITTAIASNTVSDSMLQSGISPSKIGEGTIGTSEHTVNLYGNASTATTATYLISSTTNIGDSSHPVYFSGGKPVQIGGTIGSSTSPVSLYGNASTATKATYVTVSDTPATGQFVTVDNSGGIQYTPFKAVSNSNNSILNCGNWNVTFSGGNIIFVYQ